MTMDDLARRAVACPGWRWRPRMAALLWAPLGPRRVTVLDVDDRGIPTRWHFDDVDDRMSQVPCRRGIESGYGSPGWCADVWSESVPVLEDPATLGAVLALVREAYDAPTLTARHELLGWCVDSADPDDERGSYYFEGSEAAALIAALEAAP